MKKESMLRTIGLMTWNNIINNKERAGGIIPWPLFLFMRLFCFPGFAAILANAHAFVNGFQLLPLGGKNLDNQRRNGQEDPLDGKPPPTDEKPPKDAAVFGLQFGFRYHLDIYIGAAALGTSHFNSPSTFWFLHYELDGLKNQSVLMEFSVLH